MGNLRPRNPTPTILGNVRDRGFWERNHPSSKLDR
jgi:hypothetical protein